MFVCQRLAQPLLMEVVRRIIMNVVKVGLENVSLRRIAVVATLCIVPLDPYNYGIDKL